MPRFECWNSRNELPLAWCGIGAFDSTLIAHLTGGLAIRFFTGVRVELNSSDFSCSKSVYALTFKEGLIGARGPISRSLLHLMWILSGVGFLPSDWKKFGTLTSSLRFFFLICSRFTTGFCFECFFSSSLGDRSVWTYRSVVSCGWLEAYFAPRTPIDIGALGFKPAFSL